jgi:hypothetical protein
VDDVIARGSSVTHTGTLDRPLIGAHGPIANLSGHKAEMSSPGVLLIDVDMPSHASFVDPVLGGDGEFTMRTGLLPARRGTKAGLTSDERMVPLAGTHLSPPMSHVYVYRNRLY